MKTKQIIQQEEIYQAIKTNVLLALLKIAQEEYKKGGTIEYLQSLENVCKNNNIKV